MRLGKAFEPPHLSAFAEVANTLRSLRECRHDLGFVAKLMQESFEVIRWNNRLIGKPSMHCLARDAVDAPDLCPTHPRGLRIKENLALQDRNPGCEVMGCSDPIPSVGRVEEIPDICQKNVRVVSEVSACGLHDCQ